MGVSSDGEISFGVLFEEDYEFPWDNKDTDIEDWWIEVQGFKPSIEIYDETGNYIGGVKPSEEVFHAYYMEKTAFKKAHPLPVKEVNYQSGDYPAFILAVPSSARRCSRGDPSEFDPTKLVVTEEEVKALTDFCQKYGLEFSKGPAWLLSSYMG